MIYTPYMISYKPFYSSKGEATNGTEASLAKNHKRFGTCPRRRQSRCRVYASSPAGLQATGGHVFVYWDRAVVVAQQYRFESPPLFLRVSLEPAATSSIHSAVSGWQTHRHLLFFCSQLSRRETGSHRVKQITTPGLLNFLGFFLVCASPLLFRDVVF